MAFNIGVNVVEVDGAGAPSITAAAASVGAFNVLTQRGIANQPVRVTSFPQFVERFGGYFTHGLGAYLVKGFFDNGGQTAYVNRVVDSTPTTGTSVASRTLLDAGNAGTLLVEAAYRGQPDPGEWGRGLFLRVQHSSTAQSRLRESAPATITGSAIAATVDMSAFPKLAVQVDGNPVVTQLTFTATDFANPSAATRAEIRDAINRQTHLLVAAVPADRLVLTSTGERAALTGDWTGLRVTADTAALGFTTMANPTQGTPVSLAAGASQLARPDAFEVGDAIVIADGTTTGRARLLSLDRTTGAATWAPVLANPGAFTDLRRITVSNAEFDLAIASGGPDEDHIVETHTALSMETGSANYAPRVLNNPLSGSRYFRLTDVGTPDPGQDRPVAGTAFLGLQNGSDGTPTATDFIGDEAAAHRASPRSTPFDVQLDLLRAHRPGDRQRGARLLRGRGDCMFIGAVPEGYVAGGQADRLRPGFQGKKVYGALYGPWIVVPDPIGLGDNPQITLPPIGHVMGVYARIETTRGIWKAPAGDEAQPARRARRRVPAERRRAHRPGRAGQRQRHPRDPARRDRRSTPRARSVTDTRWRYVNVRLLFNYVKSSLQATGCAGCGRSRTASTLWDAVKYRHGDAVPARAVAAGRLRHRDAGRGVHRHRATRPTTRRTRSSRATFKSRSTSTRPSRRRRSSSSSASSPAAPPRRAKPERARGATRCRKSATSRESYRANEFVLVIDGTESPGVSKVIGPERGRGRHDRAARRRQQPRLQDRGRQGEVRAADDRALRRRQPGGQALPGLVPRDVQAERAKSRAARAIRKNGMIEKRHNGEEVLTFAF